MKKNVKKLNISVSTMNLYLNIHNIFIFNTHPSSNKIVPDNASFISNFARLKVPLVIHGMTLVGPLSKFRSILTTK